LARLAAHSRHTLVRLDAARRVAGAVTARHTTGFKSHPPESNRRPTDYERTQEVAGRFRRVAVAGKIRGLRVPLIHQQAAAAMGMVTGWRLTDGLGETVTY